VARGPLEEEVHNMMSAAWMPKGPFSMEVSELVITLLGQLDKTEKAVERVAAEVDRMRAASSQ
jgi:hypothetical protein